MNSTVQIIIDAVMLVSIAAIIAISVKRGFIKSFFKSVKILIVILVTVLIGTCLSGAFEDWFVGSMFENKVSDALVSAAEQAGESFDASSAIDALPSFITNAIPSEELDKYVSESSQSGVDMAREIGEKIENVLIKTVSDIFSYIAVFIIAFIVCTVAVIVLDGVFTLPVLNGINKIMGFVFGAAYAYVFASVAVAVAYLVFGADTLDGTLITKIIYKIGLFTH